MRVGAVVLGLMVVCAASAPGVAHAQQQQGPVVLRVATLAPKGSAWAKRLEEAGKQIDASTSGRVVVKFYFSGAQGDEMDVVRKLGQGSLEGALLTTVGLAAIEPDTEVLSLPRMATNDAEWVVVKVAVEGTLRRAAAQRGFAIIDVVSIGEVKLGGVGGLASLADWRQQTVAVYHVPYFEFFAQLGVPAQLLKPSQMLPALQKQQAHAVPATPLTMVALQFYTKLQHLSEVPLGRLVCGLVFRETALKALDPADRGLVEREFGAAMTALEKVSAKDDQRATKAMRKAGVALDQPDAQLVTALDQAAEATFRAVAGSLVSLPVLNAALAARQRVRGATAISITTAGGYGATTKMAIASRSPPPAATAVQSAPPARTGVALASVATEAPDDLRALWLAFDECDASMLSLFVQFPIAIAGTRYASAKALAKACKAGALSWPSASVLEAALPGLQVGDRGATLVVGERTLRLEWQAESWMLAGAE